MNSEVYRAVLAAHVQSNATKLIGLVLNKQVLKVAPVNAWQSFSREETQFGDVHGLQTLSIHCLHRIFLQVSAIFVCPNTYEPQNMEVLYIKWLLFLNSKCYFYCKNY